MFLLILIHTFKQKVKYTILSNFIHFFFAKLNFSNIIWEEINYTEIDEVDANSLYTYKNLQKEEYEQVRSIVWGWVVLPDRKAWYYFLLVIIYRKSVHFKSQILMSFISFINEKHNMIILILKLVGRGAVHYTLRIF